ncbi:MAG: enoyl-CoA hydratase/isomerase family protein [Bacteroidia bacterium]|nr:enoyl-CoA hydratase/isomerase family protein [Bacteroidia bacterium]MCZ2276468.1 enoyl-CoA hydratase/isomerase family protein [Bacteroidia bacterium]
MSYKNILYSCENRVCTITVNRPEKLNALNRETIAEIGRAIKSAESDQNIRAVILTGSGNKSFIAGADISEFALFTPDQGKELSQHGHDVFNAVERCSKPVIAAVNGFALGGGCELAMACHIRYASENAKFGQPEVKLGLTPGYGGTQRLPRFIGTGRAIELLITGDMIDAQEAYRLGLVNKVVPQQELMNDCFQLAQKIVQQAPVAIAQVLNCVNDFMNKKTNGFDTEVNSFGYCISTKDFKEGTSAFLDKRKPVFKGN